MIAAYLARTCGAADWIWLDEHLQSCTRCYRILAAERFRGRPEFAVSAVPTPARVRERRAVRIRFYPAQVLRRLARYRAGP